MIAGRWALLIGLVVVPAVLLWLGHRLRERTPAQRGAFWGGVIGHTVALLVALVPLHWPPVLWQDEARLIGAFWLVLAGGVGGMVVGALRARR